jgi:hypothetical protein
MSMPVFKLFPVIFIVVTIINYFIFKRRIKDYIEKKPDLKEGYDKLLKGFVFFQISPWIIVVLGDICGSTNGVFDYFRPRSLNPFVLAFHGYLVILFALTIYWVYFKGGANFLSRHPGFIHFQGFGGSREVTSPLSIKIFFALCLLGGIAGLVMMWFLNFPVTHVKMRF